MKGKLIIIEGIDGSGTTTQSFLLYKNLKKKF
jgi:thymidylate kinase